MKKKLIFLLVLLVGLVYLPFGVNAKEKEYTSLNLREALAEEEIAEEFSNYEETDDQVTIYLFRGRGCSYCRAYLSFMNSITEEYGKYFKIKSFEVWYDDNNNSLMNDVSTFLGKKATGVPYIIIGDKVFAGYTSSYDEEIKTAIVDLYNTSKEDRYDVLVEMEKKSVKIETTLSTAIIWNLVFVTIGAAGVIIYNKRKFDELEEKIENLNKKQSSKKN